VVDSAVFKVLDATLKEITAALLESDVNVKLVATLRQKVKAKVKSSLEGNSADNSKEVNKKNLIQKVSSLIIISSSTIVVDVNKGSFRRAGTTGRSRSGALQTEERST